MAHEDESQKCNGGSGSGNGGNGNNGNGIGFTNLVRSLRKQKPKKVPQRGLGVAQLEKIRLEEQQKKDSNAITMLPLPISPSNHTTTTTSTPKSSYLSIPFASTHSSSTSSSSSSIPFPADFSSKSSIFRPAPPSFFEGACSSTASVPLPNPTGWPPPPPPPLGNSKMWSSSEFNIEEESSKVDPGLAFRSNMILPFESNPVWPMSGLMQNQCHGPSSSMVNISSATSSSPSSSILNFQMEPPSNQSYYGNNASFWPEEEKMVAMKRPYPFSLDNPPGPSFHCKFPPLGQHPIGNTSSELPSYGNGNTLNLNPGIPVFREGTSYPAIESSSKRSNNKSRVNSCRDFLSLAIPTSSSTINQPSTVNMDYCNGDCSQFEALPYQARVEDSEIGQGSNQANQKKPYFSFLPPATGQATTSISSCNGGGDEGRESVDLNLKL